MLYIKCLTGVLREGLMWDARETRQHGKRFRVTYVDEI